MAGATSLSGLLGYRLLVVTHRNQIVADLADQGLLLFRPLGYRVGPGVGDAVFTGLNSIQNLLADAQAVATTLQLEFAGDRVPYYVSVIPAGLDDGHMLKQWHPPDDHRFELPGPEAYELHVVFEKLFHRFPNLRLAEPFESLPFKYDSQIYGLYGLPVEW